MRLPLYKDANLPAKPGGANLGLWYERFFNQFTQTWEVEDSAKNSWIDTVSGCRNIDQTSTQRFMQLVGALNGMWTVFTTDWNFVTGLGNAHPVENGFTWHHTLGAPYMCGAAVKGLVRAWVEAWEDFEDCRDGGTDVAERRQLAVERSNLWFGESAGDGSAGCLVFFDALPVGSFELTADVMTPHMGKWYEQGGNPWTGNATGQDNADRVPADWHDPVPVQFLAVQKASFLFAIAPRNPHSELHRQQVSLALSTLGNALEWLGAGAKTAAGYGRMSRDDHGEDEIRSMAQRTEQARLHQAAREQQPPHELLISDYLEQEKLLQPGQAEESLLWMKLKAEAATDSSGRWPRAALRAAAERIRAAWQHNKRWQEQERKQKANKIDRDYAKTREFLTLLKELGVELS